MARKTKSWAARQSEAEWQRVVTDAAELYGWTWIHFRKVRVKRADGSHYWHTPVAGPGGIGWPDLQLWRERVIYVELKAEDGRVEPEQHARHVELEAAGAELYVFRPSDYPLLIATLRRSTR